MENWQKLFGIPQDCECKDCNSIFSPASYLVDIMQYLDNCKNANGKSILQILFERRPDIGNLLLTCENTNTEIPYIDLVNEIMEYYVAHSKDASIPFIAGDTGKATVDELRAEPQFTIMKAYGTIYENAVYPFSAPYHQPLDVIRNYLNFLKTSRAELMEVFPYCKGVPITQTAIDAENMSLSLKEFEILTNKDFSGNDLGNVSAETYFGYSTPVYTGKAIQVTDLLQRIGLQYTDLIEILDAKFINPGQNVLKALQYLIAGSNIQSQNLYNELKNSTWQSDASFTSLLQNNNIANNFDSWLNTPKNGSTNFQNFQKLVILYQPNPVFKLDEIVLHSLKWLYEGQPTADNCIDQDFLSNLHRFIRLWRKTGWDIHELDTIISALGKNAIDKDLIHNLATIKRINTILNLPLLKLACLWGNIDTYGDNSLYVQLFLKNTGHDNNSADTNIFVPNPLNEIISGTSSSSLLSDHLPEICAALTISADELSAALLDAKIDAGVGKVSLENLSAIYRYKLLADTVKISIDELCTLKSKIFNINPFNSVDDTLDFIQKVQKIQSSGFSMAVLNYILSDVVKDIDNIALKQDSILQMLPEMRNQLIKIDQDNPGDAQSIKQLKQIQLISFVSSLTGLDVLTARTICIGEIDNLISNASEKGLSGIYFNDKLFQNSVNTKTDPEINFSNEINNLSVRWNGWICPPSDGDYTFTVNVSETDETATLWINRVNIIEINIDAAQPNVTSKQGTVSLVGGKMYQVTLEYTKTSGNAGIQLFWQSATMSQSIIDEKYLYPDAKIQILLQNIVFYHRAAQFITRFNLTSDEVNYFAGNNTDFDNIDFSNLTSTQWLRMYDYTQLRKIIPSSLLLKLFQSASLEYSVNNNSLPSDALISAIANASGWNKDYLSYLAGNTGNSNISPVVTASPSYFKFIVKDFKNEIPFIKIKQALDLAKKTNMAINDAGLPAWVQIETDPLSDIIFNSLHGIAEQIKNAVKSKYNDNWLTIARQLNDKIRENQKQALINYLLTCNLMLNGKPVTDANTLYEYLLIDVQMAPNVHTSRLIQATMAVQLFADRCLLNLESEVDINASKIINPDEWEWMKHYSVAAGLKKLFVYVENYLDTSLRDDKSPFFKDLESQLKKSDITDVNVENAFRDYLFKLNEVSNIELCGMYNDKDTKTLHVFARTHAAPYNYYYRTQDCYGHWSAWEEVQLDIKSIDDGENSGVHLMPVVWKKRLFLFWPEFMEKSVSPMSPALTFKQMSDTSSDDILPQKYWEVRLAWSEYAHGKWTPKKISKETFSPFFQIWLKSYQAYNKNIYDDIQNGVTDEGGNYEEFFYVPNIPSKCFSFNIAINSTSQELEITISIGSGYIGGVCARFFKKEPLLVCTIVLQDITSNLVLLTMEENQSIIIDYYNYDDSDPEDPIYFTSYQPFYQQYYIKNAKLTLSSIDFLQDTIDHKILFSNDIGINVFKKSIQYPFFYTDINSNRVYFALPADISIYKNTINRLKNPGIACLAFIDKMAAETPTTVYDSDMVSSVQASNVKPFKMILPAINKPGDNAGLMLTKGSQKNMQDANYLAPSFANSTIPLFKFTNEGLAFYTFYHPFASIFIKKLNQGGVEALLDADTAEFPEDTAYPNIDTNLAIAANDNGATFEDKIKGYNPDYDYVQKYDPSDNKRNYYLQNVDFSEYGTYSIYNWELFFHAPFLIATRLSKNGKYSEARKWFHYIFNPLSTETPYPDKNSTSPFWQVLPFKKTLSDDIISYITNLSPGYDSDPTKSTNPDNNKQIDEWRADPFNAFLIARNRPIAFMKNVVMSYLDNLIAWGDDLFRTYTRENINEATQLYVMAAHILGPKPQYIPPLGTIQPKSFNMLTLDDFGEAIVSFENEFPNSSEIQQTDNSIPQNLLGIGHALYFCVPPNDQLLRYWTKVGDRLFKIRHGQNIDGIVKPLALYEPPIDPALLLKAKAQGLDIGSILADLESPAPLYRFTFLLQKAKEFCNEVVALGSALLSANEKQDAEALARIRQTQEIAMLQMVTEVKARQVLEAQANLDALITNRATTIQKLQHYVCDLLGNSPSVVPDPLTLPDTLKEDSSLPTETIIAPVASSIDVGLTGTDESGVKIIPKEKQEMDYSDTAKYLQLTGNAGELLAAIFNVLPTAEVLGAPLGVGGSSKVFDGFTWGSAISAIARAAIGASSLCSAEASSAARMASYIRREQDWVFQANMAAREIVQLDKQITAAQIRLQMAEHELDNHKQQIQNSQDIEQFFETKFTNQELYQWMIDKLQDVHKQGYQLAYDMARKAEKAYRFELGIQDSSFIQYGYYEDSYLGITAGEQLQLALKQMDSAFLDNNIREFELTKHISLNSLDPAALLQLIETGTCQFDIPEEWFDMDYPGHYFRRIKSISISIPCVTGPYTTVNSTLRLQKNSIRIKSDLNSSNSTNPYVRDPNNPDSRFIENNIPFTAIATSSAQNDSGTFELNFRDERYLPFEGAGVISTWQLELNGKYTDDQKNIIDLSQFDYSTISDIIIHIRYTSREDAGDFRKTVIGYLNKTYKSAPASNFMRLFRVKHDFPNEFYAFINKPATNGDQILKLNLDESHFPYFASLGNIQANKIEYFADSDKLTQLIFFEITLDKDNSCGSLLHNIQNGPLTINSSQPQMIQLTYKKTTSSPALKKGDLNDLYVLIRYSIS